MKAGKKEQVIKLELNKLVLAPIDIVVVRVGHVDAIRPVTDTLRRRKIFPKGQKVMVVPPGITFEKLADTLKIDDLVKLIKKRPSTFAAALERVERELVREKLESGKAESGN